MIEARRLAILAEGKLGVITSKTAACVVRYQPERVACLIDNANAGLTAQDVLGFGGAIPVVGSVREATRYAADSLLIGIAPRGGLLPDEWRGTVIDAIESGMHVLSGLHSMLAEDPQIREAARRAGVTVWDIRNVVLPDGVAKGVLRQRSGHVVLTVGSDCSSGKMTAAYELSVALKKRGVRAEFVATGQTGILLSGWGQAIDRAPGDFMARIAEDLTLEGLNRGDVAIVEGQGSLIHPAYSGVTLALMHGSWPEAMILCHQPTRTRIDEYDVEIPPLKDLVAMYERACRPLFASRVVAVALNTYDLDEPGARAETSAVQKETGLPTTDPVRWGPEELCEAIEDLL